jgi:hypothetical protein
MLAVFDCQLFNLHSKDMVYFENAFRWSFLHHTLEWLDRMLESLKEQTGVSEGSLRYVWKERIEGSEERNNVYK